MIKIWNNIRYGLLLLLIVLIAFSSYPSVTRISRAAGMESGTFLSPYVLLVFSVLFAFCIKSIFRLKIQRRLWLLLLFVLISFLCVYFGFGSKTMLNDIRSIGICFGAIAIGCHLKLEENGYSFLLFAFSVLVTFIGLMQVLFGVGGFEIHDQYISDNKNSIGVELVTAILIDISFFFNKEKKVLLRIGFLLLAVFSFVIILTIRARTATLASLLIVVFFVFETYKNNYHGTFVFRIVGIIIIVGIVILLLPNEFSEYVYNSFWQNHEDDITSGRTERNIAAIKFLRDNILVGNLEGYSRIPWIHNYPLLKLYDYGLFFSFPILFLYLYLLVKTVKYTIKNKVTEWSVGNFALIIPFIISMAEPTFPFGPGTATVFNFILFGISLNHFYEESNALSLDNQ